ncbi:MAG: flagellar hook-length control protein FliK [Nitrospirae bacterium]|nr:flagellar hook-length control protein FliK [Nitrospirota bacterium]
MNINLFQMFAGPKMPQGAEGLMNQNLQQGGASEDFSGILQALLIEGMAGNQIVDLYNTAASDASTANASTSDSDAVTMISESLRDGLLTTEELAGIIQGMLAQMPNVQTEFALKLGNYLASSISANQLGQAADIMKAAVNQAIQYKSGLQNIPAQVAGGADASSAEPLNQSTTASIVNNGVSDMLNKFNKPELTKTDTAFKDTSAAPKGMNAEDFFKQLASKITDQKSQNLGGFIDNSASSALKQGAGEDVFSRLVSEITKSADNGTSDKSTDILKNATDIKLSATASAHAHNSQEAAAATKEISYVSKVHEIDQVIMKMANSGQQRLILRIDPPELGSIQIKLVMENGVIRADFRFDNQAAKESFALALPQIKTSLEDAGIRTGEFFADLKDDYYSDRKEGQDRPQHNKNGNRQKEEGSFFELFA